MLTHLMNTVTINTIQKGNPRIGVFNNPISESLISLRLAFIPIRRLRAESYAVVGQVINVPIDVNIMVQHLLRNLDDDQAFNENIEKRLNHKSIYLSGEVRKRVVRLG
ncbi:hypothetical protein AVEN_48749-1 [Araneus ventricosus]|uniref:Uncharacterized protein n=1 Tax=Araneus ventricosus TaxID=182803 RepID=A0A4Y2W0J6_ARAVE|nr:hypothetical protein AVEN_102699-1 [Araneus ventricosus]GBO30088.1 hypothetical protein AVEN_48749-1 [Araneus ventricosus]